MPTKRFSTHQQGSERSAQRQSKADPLEKRRPLVLISKAVFDALVPFQWTKDTDGLM